jgi:hypothetical protein
MFAWEWETSGQECLDSEKWCVTYILMFFARIEQRSILCIVGDTPTFRCTHLGRTLASLRTYLVLRATDFQPNLGRRLSLKGQDWIWLIDLHPPWYIFTLDSALFRIVTQNSSLSLRDSIHCPRVPPAKMDTEFFRSMQQPRLFVQPHYPSSTDTELLEICYSDSFFSHEWRRSEEVVKISLCELHPNTWSRGRFSF